MISFGIRDGQQSYPVREAAYGLLIKEATIAIVSTPRGYFLPGGGIEGDETHEACIVRELHEEIGITVKVSSYIMTTRLTDITPSRDYPIDMVAHCYRVEDTGGREMAVEDDHDLVWMGYEEASYALKLPHQSWVARHLAKAMQEKTIVPYNAHWKWWFVTIKNHLRQALDNEAITIEHIGSTAIPGMLSKPVIDIDVVLPLGTSFEDVCQSLSSVGYEHMGDQGIEGREAFKRQNCQVGVTLDQLPHHLYVCYENSEELKRHLTFRDKLQKEDVLRDTYIAIKRAIIDQVGPYNRGDYVEIKAKNYEGFFQKVLQN